MVFVRVHVRKGYLDAEQKQRLGDALVAAIAEAEDLHNSDRHKQTSWVQYFELEPENWYAPATIGNPEAFWQVDVIGPAEYLPDDAAATLAIAKVTEAIRSISGPGVLPARGPWVHVYAIPHGYWGQDGAIPDFETAREYFKAETPEEAAEILSTVFGRTVELDEVS